MQPVDSHHGWGLYYPPIGCPAKPLLQVAYSESAKKLESDVKSWLNPGEEGANVTLTLQIDPTKPTRERVTRHSMQSRGIENTQIIILKSDDEHVKVSCDPLVIPFDLIFRRKPIGG
ncbi:uncharacterized protein N7446_013841 [Penicillium canescens]|uniref:Uncharacterized protein n=1 Tax=Penicillium canescens TaxID=5083 RepID=A0AAD6HZQ5_PENCN|nr:uncharacterized protein N7446_013841 [Penicillium canescens]KAJ6023479.1 hypothetical protein N7460_013874 [Penicillium canescens]KAJ6042775.1 hypothetical protein N7446_013841 [Penicillium canescens]